MLTENQKKAVAMLHDFQRVMDVAAACGVHRTTIWRWSQKRDFRREWQRIERNARRRYERQRIREDIRRQREWERIAAEADAELSAKLQKICSKPGKNHQKAVDRAWNDYSKALFHGRTWAEVLSLFDDNKPRRHRRRRRI